MRSVFVLALAQFFGAFGQVATVLLAGLIGAALAPDEVLATLPVTTAVLGVASATVPVGMALQRWGRRPVLLGGALWSAAGCLLAAGALERGNFALYCLATYVVGTNLAFTAQYRFAAAEAVAVEQVSRAVTVVMLGTLGAAFISPWLAVASRGWIGEQFVGSYLTLAVIFALNFLTLTAYRDTGRSPAGHGEPARPLAVLVRQPDFFVAVTAAAVAYGVMSLLMTATPISMHVHDGHSVESTALVLQSHVIGMYAPSFLSGLLVARLGVTTMLGTGLLAYAVCATLALTGQNVPHYWGALTLLGIGWNLLFVAATTLLTRAYRPSERFRAQTANDFVMFTAMALSSLAAGPLVAGLGWRGVVEFSVVLIAALAAVVAGITRRQRRAVENPG